MPDTEWFESIFDETLEIDFRLDRVFAVVDEMLLAERFEECSQFFYTVIQDYWQETVSDLAIAIGLLTVSHGSQEHVKGRTVYYRELWGHLESKESKARALQCLGGLG